MARKAKSKRVVNCGPKVRKTDSSNGWLVGVGLLLIVIIAFSAWSVMSGQSKATDLDASSAVTTRYATNTLVSDLSGQWLSNGDLKLHWTQAVAAEPEVVDGYRLTIKLESLQNPTILNITPYDMVRMLGWSYVVNSNTGIATVDVTIPSNKIMSGNKLGGYGTLQMDLRLWNTNLPRLMTDIVTQIKGSGIVIPAKK